MGKIAQTSIQKYVDKYRLAIAYLSPTSTPLPKVVEEDVIKPVQN
jgi:ABC-type iron transport system FetAB ATPase subunit